jgi:hypothetical protein
MSPAPGYREVAGLLAGFALWAAAFVALYAGHGYVCSAAAEGPPLPAARPLLAGMLVLFVAAHAALAAWLFRRWRSAPAQEPVRQLRLWAFVLAVGALLTTAWTGLPAVALSLCT